MRRSNKKACFAVLANMLALLVGFESGCGRPMRDKENPVVEPIEQGGEAVTGLPLEGRFDSGLEWPKEESERIASYERGQAAFYTYGCWHCHSIGDDEPPGMRNFEAMGPDLVDVGHRLTAEEIRHSLLYPNEVIAEPRDQHMTDGISNMPAFNDPKAQEDIRDIVFFLSESVVSEKTQSLLIEVTENNFDEIVSKAEGYLLLDFWAEWCFACLELNPVLEAIAPDYRGRLTIGKIDADENPELVSRYVPDVMFPCLVLMKGNEVLDRRYGADPTKDPEDFFREWFSELESQESESFLE